MPNPEDISVTDSPNEKKSLRSIFQKLFGAKQRRAFLLFLAATVLIYCFYLFICAPKRYDLKVGSIAHETITATKDVVDEVATDEKRNSAASSVEPTYHFQEGIAEQVVSDLDTLFCELRLIQQYGLTLRDGDETPAQIRAKNFTEDEINYANELSKSVTLSRYQILTLLRTDTTEFENMVSTVETAVSNSMTATVREGQTNQAVQNIIQIVGYRLDVSLTQNVVPTVLRACIRPNMIIDQEATDINRENARNAVENVTYLQGQNIIREGERVSSNQIEMLRSLGLLKDNQYDFSTYWGAAILVFLCMFSLYIQLRILNPELITDTRKLAVTLIVIVLSVAIAVCFLKLFNAYFIPLSLGCMLLTVLLGSNVGFVSIIPLAVLTAGLSAGSNAGYVNEMLHLFLMSSISGIVSVQFLSNKPMRTRLILSGLMSAALNALIMIALTAMTSSDLKTIYANIGWACGGALVSGILALSLQPIFENVFHLATASKLLELVNPDQPLLRRLLIEAPGTYHHSIVVANLAEAAAERVGGNSLLARAGAYYHDIGKLKRPQYFSENQMGTNPHDTTDPYISSAIITSHTSDGVFMAQQEHLPIELQDIISQHHGDTATMFFYHKALQMANGSPIDVNDFRYTEKRPQTKEATIVMLADTVEAAVRSMKDPTPNGIRKFIERLIRNKLEDGQLTDSPILICDLDDIADAFTNVLKGVFHERIEYPKMSVQAQAAMQQLSQVMKENAQASATNENETSQATVTPSSADDNPSNTEINEESRVLNEN